MEHGPLHLLTILWYTTPVVQAFTSFDSNCTIPDQRYDYVQGPNTRGSLQIIWSCLVTLIASTYTVLHLNIPPQRVGSDRAPDRYQRTWWRRVEPSIVRTTLAMTAVACPPLDAAGPHSRRSLTMVGPMNTEAAGRFWIPQGAITEMSWWFRANVNVLCWMTITMLAPEYYAMIAFDDAESATFYRAEFEKLPPHRHPVHGWALTHMYFANMGGFAIRSNTRTASPSITHLTASSLLKLIKRDTLCINYESLPTQEEVHDRSKNDNFARIIVVLQIAWFITNCIARLAKGLATTQLEMSIMGTAVCSLVSYSMLFQKPHAVKTAVVVVSFDGEIPSHVAKIIAGDGAGRGRRGTISNMLLPRVPSDRAFPIWARNGLVALLAAVLGASHIAAWNFAFPTETDKWIWRANSIITGVVVVGFYVMAIVGDIVSDLMQSRLGLVIDDRDAFGKVVMVFAILIYIVSRGILAVEMIRFLLYLPPGAFLTTWADNIPHI